MQELVLDRVGKREDEGMGFGSVFWGERSIALLGETSATSLRVPQLHVELFGMTI